MSVAARQYGALSRRSFLTQIRQPRSFIPSLLFPLMFLALSSAAFDRTTELPGFPESDSFLQFLITTSIIQGVLFGAVAAGSEMAHDIEDGFFDRLIASPVSRSSILIGRISGSTAIGFLQAWLYFGIGHFFGLQVEGGLLGMLGVASVAGFFAAGVGSIATAFGIRTGSSEAVQGAFPLLFAMMFLSGAFFPRTLMHGWFKAVATANPLTHMIEGLRQQVIAGFEPTELWRAFVVASGFFVVGLLLALAALRGRLKAVH
ncbi:MAG TPA: ABC transporter permease [Actinomycetota bacterium]|nr:ABC transporter permease [Actinomycetota bacterium]